MSAASVGLAALAGLLASRRQRGQAGSRLPLRAKSRGFGAAAPAAGKSARKQRQQQRANAAGVGPPGEEEIKALESAVNSAVERHLPQIVEGLRERGWWASDGPVLPAGMRTAMRAEVEALWQLQHFKLSQSVRGTEYYDKDNVYATEIGSDKYEAAPRLVHYTVNATRSLAARIREAFPEAPISGSYIGNKLNMSVGNGASFDPHLDVGVAEKPFNRKLTLLLYLNDWREELGGQLALLGEGATEEEAALDTGTAAAGLPVRLPPTSGRWVVFWSDRILHKVEASEAPGGMPDYRVSYTIWFCTEDEPRFPAAAAPVAGPSGGYESAPSFARF